MLAIRSILQQVLSSTDFLKSSEHLRRTMAMFAEDHGQVLSIDDEYLILETCCDWSLAESKQRRTEVQQYFSLYREQLRQLDLDYDATGGKVWPFAQRSHRQLLDTVDVVRDLGDEVTFEQVRKEIQVRSGLIIPHSSILDSLVYAALRVWLLVNFRAPEDESIGANRPCIQWPEDTLLKSALDAIFTTSETVLSSSQRRLSPLFTAANMVSICGLKIEWASTLDDHLYLDRQHKVLRIFPHRDWLLLKAEAASASNNRGRGFAGVDVLATDKFPLASSSSKICSAPFPAEVYEETSRTLDLLFPSWDKPTQRFLRRKARDFHSSNSQKRMLDLKFYPYWKDRILELNEDVFMGPAEGWAQLWNDRRDPQKFWTFWIALAVFTLTMASTVASVVQIWATLRTMS